MRLHRNAKTTPVSRAQLVQWVCRDGWTQRQAAAGSGVSVRTVAKWVARYRAHGVAGLEDRSCRPRRSPRHTPPSQEQRILHVRQREQWPGRRIAVHLGVPPATVARVLRRHGQARLPRAPRPPVVRYEWPVPGDLLHVDVKKLGRFAQPGHRVHGNRRRCTRGAGWEFVHVCVDDHSRLAYVEVLGDEGGQTSAGFLRRAVRWYRAQGVTCRRVLSDNGSGYVSRRFRQTCEMLGLRPLRTRPYHPRTNGKAERFIQTLTREWAYGQAYSSSGERAWALPRWLHFYNTRRLHGGIGHRAPITRLRAAA